MQSVQARHALARSFGALYAGDSSPFFFRSWKVAYGKYNGAIASAFTKGRDWVADFDLVSYYELIDHNLLRSVLGKRVKDAALLDQLTRCLSAWTTNASGSDLRHGVPQGPEASAFLAECVLFAFDDLALKDVTYLRYVDDIRLLARDEVPLRKAMIHLDLLSKDLGLVPQAQKLGLKRYKSVDEILKTIPSALAAVHLQKPAISQRELRRMWSKSLKKRDGAWHVDDVTRFRFAVHRLKRRRSILRRNSRLLLARPDLAPALASYFRQFTSDREAADLLLRALLQDPAYDWAAAAYVDALDGCEPETKTAPYRRAVRTALRRSVEQSLVLRAAVRRFLGRRMGIADFIQFLRGEKDSRVVALVVAARCAGAGGEPFTVSSLSTFLTTLVSSRDADTARFAASLLLSESVATGVSWKSPKRANPAVTELLLATGLRKRGPTRRTALDVFFEKQGVLLSMNWRKALGTGLADAERRVVRLQHLRLTDPTAFVLMLDTFNETLVYAFARADSTLAQVFAAAAGANAHPEFGSWINNGKFQKAIPTVIPWLKAVHELRLEADLAHAKHKKGAKKGKSTRTITHQEVSDLMKGGPGMWRALLYAWRAVL